MTVQDLVVLYETNHVIVVVKPRGVLAQPDSTNDESIFDIVKDYLKIKYHKPGNVYLGLVHRLDRMTSGIMILAKTSKGAARLSEEIRTHQITKRYLAVVEGVMEQKKGTLINQLAFDEKKLRAFVVPQGKASELDYEVLQENSHFSLLDITLKTGRHHQIRAQMAHIHHPLYGDTLYGSKYQQPILLHAYAVTFFDPITKEKIEIKNYPTWYERK